MPINAQRNSSNTNKPHSARNVFLHQAHSKRGAHIPASGPAATAGHATTTHPAGAPRALPLNADQIGISRDYARLPADPTEKRTHGASTQMHLSGQGRGHLLHNGEGVLPVGHNPISTANSGTAAPRRHAQAQTQSKERPAYRHAPPDPDTHRTFFASVQRPPRGVRQDKARLENARTASRQPAPVTKVTRARLTNNGVVRSQNGARPKSQRVTLWVNPLVKAELCRIAEQEGLSVSAAGAAFLSRALQQNVDLQYSALLEPIIEKAIARQMRLISTRLAWLLVRVAFDSGQTRSLVTNILSRQPGVSQSLLKNIMESSGKSAKANITRRTPQMTQLIEAVEQWITEEERGE